MWSSTTTSNTTTTTTITITTTTSTTPQSTCSNVLQIDLNIFQHAVAVVRYLGANSAVSMSTIYEAPATIIPLLMQEVVAEMLIDDFPITVWLAQIACIPRPIMTVTMHIMNLWNVIH